MKRTVTTDLQEYDFTVNETKQEESGINENNFPLLTRGFLNTNNALLAPQ